MASHTHTHTHTNAHLIEEWGERERREEDGMGWGEKGEWDMDTVLLKQSVLSKGKS